MGGGTVTKKAALLKWVVWEACGNVFFCLAPAKAEDDRERWGGGGVESLRTPGEVLTDLLTREDWAKSDRGSAEKNPTLIKVKGETEQCEGRGWAQEGPQWRGDRREG